MNLKLPFAFLHILTCIFSIKAHSQTLSKSYIDSIGSSIDTNYVKFPVLYVINGIPYSDLQVDSVLTKIHSRELVDFIYISADKSPFYHKRGGVAVVHSLTDQKRKAILNNLKIIKRSFRSDTELFLNGSLVKGNGKNLIVRSLRAKRVKYIYSKRANSNNSQSTLLQVKIWLR